MCQGLVRCLFSAIESCLFYFSMIQYNSINSPFSLNKTTILNTAICALCMYLSRTFWSYVLTWWNSSSTCNILFDKLKIFYGYNSGDPRSLLLNYYILIAKFHIFRYKLDSKFPYFSSLYGITERKTTRIQSCCRSKQDFTKIPNKMDNSLTLVG